MVNRWRLLPIGAVILASGVSSVAAAEALVICHVGGPGTTAQAKPVLAKFFRHVERKGGLPAGSMNGAYHTTREKCLAFIQQKKPLFGVFDLATYLAQQKNHKLKPLACMGSMTRQRYHLLVRKGSYKRLEDLKGKTLISSHLNDLTFVSRIIFDGKLDVASHFKVKRTRRPLKGIRKLARSKADATLVDRLAYTHLAKLELLTPIESIYKSAGLPELILVVLGSSPGNDAVVSKVARALPKMCTGAGKGLCDTFQISSFTRVKAAAFRSLLKKYRK